MSSPPADVTTNAPSRLAWWLLCACGAAAAAWFLFAAAVRLCYPHELEWMEGALVDHAARVANGLPLYCEPGPEHVPFLYAPMLFWLGGAAIALGVDGLVALRLIAIGSAIGCALLIGHWVRRECGNVLPGLAASGLFLAGYGWLAWWYDLARNDALFVLACLSTAYVLRHGTARRWWWAALLATAALLCKQSALMWLPAIAVGTAFVDWRTALRFAAAAVALMAAAVLALHLRSDGWSTFFLFEMPRHHGLGDRWLPFWTEDLVPMLPLLVLAAGGFAAQWRTCARGDALFLAAFGGGALVTSWLSRLHVGGFDNVLMYGFAGACVLGPVAAANGARWLRWLGPALLLVQFGWLAERAWHRHPERTLFPSAAHRHAHEQLLVFVHAQPGPVWIPAHGRITAAAGKGTGAHGQAIFDLLQLLPKQPDGFLDLGALLDRSKLAHLSPRAQRAIAALIDGTNAALREQRFAAIVVDEVGAREFATVFAVGLAGKDGVPGTDDDPYVRLPGPVLSEPKAIAPLLGYDVHSPYALVPRR